MREEVFAMNQYDVIIIGAGPSGIFCAYELKKQRPDLRVLMIEKRSEEHTSELQSR